MSVSPPRYVGIDFSGNQAQWNPNAQASNIWIAQIEEHDAARMLVGLQRVQQLPGQGRPFARLAAWLANGRFSAAAIDAPFSVPWWFFGPGFADHPALMAAIDALEIAGDFPTGRAFTACVAAGVPFQFTKPFRTAECYWRGRGVHMARSTVWNGVRPGAPFASACIKLLACAHRPLWPWAGADTLPLIEAFPAAQLRHWGLPFALYNGVAGQPNRAAIVQDLTAHRGLQAADATMLATIQTDADALDAVLCCYAARAVVQDQLGVALPFFHAWQREGWIATHN